MTMAQGHRSRAPSPAIFRRLQVRSLAHPLVDTLEDDRRIAPRFDRPSNWGKREFHRGLADERRAIGTRRNMVIRSTSTIALARRTAVAPMSAGSRARIAIAESTMSRYRSVAGADQSESAVPRSVTTCAWTRRPSAAFGPSLMPDPWLHAPAPAQPRQRRDKTCYGKHERLRVVRRLDTADTAGAQDGLRPLLHRASCAPQRVPFFGGPISGASNSSRPEPMTIAREGMKAAIIHFMWDHENAGHRHLF